MINEIEEKIVSWLIKTRHEQKLDIIELAQRSGLAHSQISRIENRKSSITLLAVVRLCYGLNVPPIPFIKESGVGTIIYPSTRLVPLPTSINGLPPFITINDMIAFKQAYQHDSLAAQEDLLSLWKKLLDKGAGARKDTSELDVDQAKKALSSHANCQPIPYPSGFEFTMLHDIYAERGIITLADAGHFARIVRQQHNFTVVDVQKATLIGRNVISRIENGELEKIRFSDILTLDKYYQAEEFLQSVFWATFEYLSGVEYARLIRGVNPPPGPFPVSFNWMPDPIQDTLLKISRWYQVFWGREKEWIAEERRKWLVFAGNKDIFGETSAFDYRTSEPFEKIWGFISPHIYTLAKDFPDRDFQSPNNNQISEDVKRIWGFLCDYLEEYPAFKASVQDLANYPNDKDFISAFRSQVKKYLKEDQEFARDVESYFRTRQ
jgi:transcriptional regulator with XRE-family HTH domain